MGGRARLGAAVAALLTAALFARPAQATILYLSDPDVGGFVANSAPPLFLAALGDTYREHLDFSTDASGARILPAPYDDGAVAGDALSPRLVLRSPGAPAFLLPDHVLAVQVGGSFWEIGASPGYAGPLELDFLAGQGPVAALGLGTVGFRSTSTISLYDANDALLGVYPGASDATFAFVGFVASDGDRIGRVVLEGNGAFYALQDLTVTPEPGTGVMLALGLAGLALFQGRNRVLTY